MSEPTAPKEPPEPAPDVPYRPLAFYPPWLEGAALAGGIAEFLGWRPDEYDPMMVNGAMLFTRELVLGAKKRQDDLAWLLRRSPGFRRTLRHLADLRRQIHEMRLLILYLKVELGISEGGAIPRTFIATDGLPHIPAVDGIIQSPFILQRGADSYDPAAPRALFYPPLVVVGKSPEPGVSSPPGDAEQGGKT
jgi:hypothetical protein